MDGIKLDEFEQKLWARANVGLSHSLTLNDEQIDALAAEHTYSPVRHPDMRTIPMSEFPAASERLGKLVLNFQEMLESSTKEAETMRKRYVANFGLLGLETKIRTSMEIAQELKEAIDG